MARLPQPGGDDGSWGTILNGFLSQAHNNDGTLKSNSVTSSQLAPNAVDMNSLNISGGTNGQVLTKDSSKVGGISWSTATEASVAAATADSQGIIQLAGDLAGSASAPTVPGLASRYTKPSDGIPAADLTSDVQASLSAGGSAVQSVSAADATITLAGTSKNPTIKVASGTFAALASPNFTGAPTAPTQASTDNSTNLATTAYVKSVVGSGGSFNLADLANAQPFIVELPETYGAKHDNSTDDTAAIKQAVSTAVSRGISNGSYYAEIWFSSGGNPYFVGGALDTSQQGRAQIPLPYIDAHAHQKFVLVLKGISDSSAIAHWYQTVPQTGGATLRTNLSADYDSSLGSASCIGGATREGMGNPGSNLDAFSNMMVVVDGIAIQSPSNPAGAAIDLQCIAEAHVKSLGLTGSISPGNGAVDPTTLTAGGVGLRMPQTGNGDNCEIGTLSIEGYTYGLIPSEHTHVSRAAIIYCGSGVYFQQIYPDACRFDYLSTEACTYHIDSGDTNVGNNEATSIDIGTWDIEDTGRDIYHLQDHHNTLYGDIHYTCNAYNEAGPGAMLKVNGGANAHYVNLHQPRGSVAAPSVPGSGTALQNPFDRDAAVNFSGGTISTVTIDSGLTGLAGAGTVIVPSGKTITLSYSGSPEWNWTLL